MVHPLPACRTSSMQPKWLKFTEHSTPSLCLCLCWGAREPAPTFPAILCEGEGTVEERGLMELFSQISEQRHFFNA